MQVSLKGKESLDLNCQIHWNPGAGLFVVPTEHGIEIFDINHSKVVHVEALYGHFVGEMSVQNVVIATKSRGAKHLISIFRLSYGCW